jgi:DNA-binding response OmpR family regulator
VPFVFLTWRDGEADTRMGYMVRAAMYLSKRTSVERVAMNLGVFLRERKVPVRPKPTTLRMIYEHQLRHPRETNERLPGVEPPSARAETKPALPPVAIASREEPPGETQTAEPAADRPRVLIADPDHAIIFAIESTLQGIYDCIATVSGLEVLDKAQRYRPDLLILNMRVPHLPGFQVTQVLRAHADFRTTPVFGLAKADDPLRRDYLAKYGVNDLFALPAEYDRLAWKAKALIHEPDFRPHRHPQSFVQVWAEEEKRRLHHERIEAASDRLRREQMFQDFFKKSLRG